MKQVPVIKRLILFFMIFFNSHLSAQVNMVWDADYNYWQSGIFVNYDVVVDSSGNTYFAEAVSNFTLNYDSLYLIKYDSDGNFLWKNLVMSNSSGYISYFDVNIFSNGSSKLIIELEIDTISDFYTLYINCDTIGTILDSISIGESYFSPGIFDPSGNFYFNYTRSSDSTMVLEKYDSSLSQQYIATTSFWSGGWGSSPVIDGTGNAWYGFHVLSSTTDTSKWHRADLSGIITDSLYFAGGSMGTPVIDDQNYFYDAFHHQFPSNTNYIDSTKSVVRKYDASLNLIWDSGFTDFNTIRDIKVDSIGNVYAMGYYGALNGVFELKVAKFDTSGNLSWMYKFGQNNAGLSNYYYVELFLDANGNPFVAGRYYPNGFIISNSQTDKFFVALFSSTGVLIDHEVFQAPTNINFKYMQNYGNDLYLYGVEKLYRICVNCEDIISGTIFYDADSSCTYNGPDHPLLNSIVEIVPGNLHLLSDSMGFYHGYLNDGNYTVNFSQNYNFGHSCTSGTANIQITNGIPVVVNSGNYLDSLSHDISIDLGRGLVRPGMNTLFVMKYTNEGGSVQSGTLELVHDTLFTFVQADPVPDYMNGDTLQWNFSGLLQGSSGDVHLTLNTDSTAMMFTPFLNTIQVSGNMPDLNPLNNVIIDSGEVITSYDPNIKFVHPIGLGTQGLITTNDSILYYSIHFENYGNDTAFKVVLIDTLDTDLDIATLKFGASSHDYTVEIKNSNILTFTFDNILLPDSSHPDENQGFVNYRIKQKPNLNLGTQLLNSAYIFFDYNVPIQTNETVNTIFDPLSINEFTRYSDFVLFPNPVRDQLTIMIKGWDKAATRLDLFNVLGQLMMTINYERSSSEVFIKTIDVSLLENGIYFLVANGSTTRSQRFVKQ